MDFFAHHNPEELGIDLENYEEEEEYNSINDALDIFQDLKEKISELKEELNNAESYILDYVELHGGEVEINGLSVKKVAGRKLFDFKSVDEVAIMEYELKKKKEFLKKLRVAKMNDITFQAIDESTGEVLQLPEVSFGKAYIKMLKKK